MGAPLLIGNIIYTEGREIRGLYVEVENKPGTLLEILEVLRDLGMNLWTINFSSRVEIGELATGFLVIDATGVEDRLEELVEKVRSLSGVARAELVEPQFPGVLFDTYHFPVVDDRGERHMILNPTGIRGVVVGLLEEFGEAAKAFLYHQGRRIGEALAQEILDRGISDPEEALRYTLLYNAASGRHRGEIAYYKYEGGGEDRIVLRLRDNWECSEAARHGIRGPASHVERGVYAGLLEKITGRRVAVRESKCIALGDPYCEFTITFSHM